MEKQLGLSGNKDWFELATEELTRWEQQIVSRKKWVYSKGKRFTANNKTMFQNGSCFKSCATPTIKFPTEEGKLWKSGFKNIMQQSAWKSITHSCNCAHNRQGKGYNKPCKECLPTNGSSNFSVFDRDRFDGFSQVPLRLQRIPYLGDEFYKSKVRTLLTCQNSMTFHNFFHDLLKYSMTWVKLLPSGSTVKTIIYSKEIKFDFWTRQLIFQLWILMPFIHRKHTDFPWLFMTRIKISGLSRFSMTCTNPEIITQSMLPFTHWQLNMGKLVLDALQ